MVLLLLCTGGVQAQQRPAGTAGPTVTPVPGQAPPSLSSQGAGLSVGAEQIDAVRSMPPDQRRMLFESLQTEGVITPELMNQMRKEMGRKAAEQPFQSMQPGQLKPDTVDTTGRVVISEPEPEPFFRRFRKIGRYQEISTELKPFGYEFFRQAAFGVVTERKDIPVPLQYVLGPGDEVKILLWGRVSGNYSLTVDRNGNINFPQIGPVAVAGMTYQQMSEHLIKQAQNFVGTNIDISMGALKTIPIFVLGDVRHPGSYTIGSFATITDALLMAGGPSEIGSMRRVELKRNGRVATHFDLYDLFLKGDKSKDTVLMAGDVVFVPPVGSVVGLAGNVKRPAIYELRERSDLFSVLELAGGLIATAYTQQIQVERVVKGERQVVIDVDDKDLVKARDFVVQDADLVKVFNIVDKDTNAVYLQGNVKRPGKYQHKPNMRLRDLVKDATELLADTYMDYGLIQRVDEITMDRRLVPFNVGALLVRQDPAANIEVKPQDVVTVFSKWAFLNRPTVIVQGEIRGPVSPETGEGAADGGLLQPPLGTQQPSQGGTAQPQGTKAPAGQKGVQRVPERARQDVTQMGIDVTPIGSKSEISEGPSMLPTVQVRPLSEGEQMFAGVPQPLSRTDEAGTTGTAIRPPPLQVRGPQAEKIRSEVERARLAEDILVVELPLQENMTVRDAIYNAGGLTKNAWVEEAELYRTDPATGRVTLLRVNLKKALEGDVNANLLLKDRDRLSVKSLLGFQYKQSVVIEGDVLHPGRYTYAQNMTLKDLIFAAGNIKESAYLEEAEVASQFVEEGKIVKIAHRKVKLGRALEGDPEANVKLRPYDLVTIKRLQDWRREAFITIAGEVRFPGRYLASKGETLSSIIERAGGFTERAYLKGSTFTRDKVKELQKRTLEEMIARLEKELASQSTADLASAVSREALDAMKAEAVQKKQFIDSLRKAEPNGRMAIHLMPMRLLKGSEFDIEIEDNDNLIIPRRNSVVNVIGSVMSMGSFVWVPEKDHKDYIELAGGYSQNADSSNTYIIKADGTARKARSGLGWSISKSQWELAGFNDSMGKLDPGDTVVVPEKLERIAWLREIKDLGQILMSMAVIAGVVYNMFD